MEQPSHKRKYGWLWVGLALLLLTGPIAIVLLVGPIEDPTDAPLFPITLILLFLCVPVGIIIYGVKQGKRVPVVEPQWGREFTYTNQTVMPPTQEIQHAPESTRWHMQQPTDQKKGVWFWVGVALLSVSASVWLVLISLNQHWGNTILIGFLNTILHEHWGNTFLIGFLNTVLYKHWGNTILIGFFTTVLPIVSGIFGVMGASLKKHWKNILLVTFLAIVFIYPIIACRLLGEDCSGGYHYGGP